MADENLSIDGNSRNIAGAVTDDSSQFIKRLRIDDTTKGLKVTVVGGSVGTGTVTSISQGTGILLTPNPIVATGTVALVTSLQPLATLGTALQQIRVNAGATALEYFTAAVSLTVGSTAIASGTTTRILYDNAGVLGEYSVIPVALGGTNATSASITAFNNITGYTALGATGTTSTNLVFSTSPVLTTPSLGAATATSINGNTFTTGTYTLTGVAGKTLTFNKSITLEGTDSTTMTFPATTATIARTDAAQTFTGTQTFSQIVTTNNAITASSNAATVPITSRISTVTNNSAATLTITITTTSAVDGMLVEVRILDFSAVAQTITWVNTENSSVSAPTTSNGSTTLPLSVLFQYNANTSKWRCLASA